MVTLLLKFRPPKIAQFLVLVAATIHWLLPVSQVTIYTNRVMGIMVGSLGFIVMMNGWWLFQKFDTAVCPTAKTDRLVTTGIYRFTRNPMYLGVILMLLGIALFFGTLPFYIATVAYFVVIDAVFCPYEENKLIKEFGVIYESYKERVRRWI